MVEEFAEVQVAGPDAGFEEEGGVDELVTVVGGCEVEVGDGTVELWDGES